MKNSLKRKNSCFAGLHSSLLSAQLKIKCIARHRVNIIICSPPNFNNIQLN